MSIGINDFHKKAENYSFEQSIAKTSRLKELIVYKIDLICSTVKHLKYINYRNEDSVITLGNLEIVFEITGTEMEVLVIHKKVLGREEQFLLRVGEQRSMTLYNQEGFGINETNLDLLVEELIKDAF